MAQRDCTQFLAGVRRRARIPSSSAAGSADSDLLQLANDEMPGMVALVQKLHANYFVVSTDTALVASTSEYDIPSRAVGAAVREIGLLLSDGSTENLDEINIEDTHGLDTSTGKPTHFYLRGNKIHVWPTPSSSSDGTLRIWYVRRPSKLVAASTGSSGNIAVVSTKTTTDVTATANIPSSFGGLTPVPLDFIRATPHFDSLYDDATPTNIGISSLTFTSGVIPSSLVAGDYIALAGYTPVPQLPDELHPIFEQRTACKWLEGQDDKEGLAVALGALKKLEEEVLGLMAPRVEGEPAAIVDFSFYGNGGGQ